MRNEILEKIKNKEIDEQLISAKSSDEVYEILKSYNIEISKEEANGILKGKEHLVPNMLKLLSEEKLELCVGGISGNGISLTEMLAERINDLNYVKDEHGNYTFIDEDIFFDDDLSIKNRYHQKKGGVYQLLEDNSQLIAESLLASIPIITAYGVNKFVNYCKEKFFK